MEPSRWMGAKVVIKAFRGRTLVEEPEEPDLEPARLRENLDCRGSLGEDGNCREALGLEVAGFGIRREVRPPPGRYVLSGAVS